jgi:hypothetical protein
MRTASWTEIQLSAPSRLSKVWAPLKVRGAELLRSHQTGQPMGPNYNDDHRHSGIGMMTPAMVHYGLAPAVRDSRQMVLTG